RRQRQMCIKRQNVYRTTHAIIFSCLAAYAQGRLRKARVAHTDAVFGLLQTGRVDENYICALLRELRPGDYELYSHPSVDHSRHELDALVSDRVRELVRQLKIKLIRYFDL
ncbi:MAG: hypothetical protein N3G20_07535, partial [Verrucomicrobiae bacterium]|nr:hypothetical protein [Verrucomicrobiae bacterium]